MVVTIRRLTADEKTYHLTEVAQLRITVFAEWPYLYDGDLAYEANYLKPYIEADQAVIIGAFDGDKLVGGSTAAPLTSHAPEFAAPFEQAGLAAQEYYYLAESVLLPQYRGQGIGVRFFKQREDAALEFGFSKAVFCAVKRPNNHPLRPKKYSALDPFWRKRGYQKSQSLKAQFSWKDHGHKEETAKDMIFWQKTLSAL